MNTMRSLAAAVALAVAPAQAAEPTAPMSGCMVLEVRDSKFAESQPMGTEEAGREFELENVMAAGPIADVYDAFRHGALPICTEGRVRTEHEGDQIFEQVASGRRLVVQPTWLRKIIFEDGAYSVAIETPSGCGEDGPVAPKLAYMELGLTDALTGQTEKTYISTDGTELCTDGMISLPVTEFQRNFENAMTQIVQSAL